MTDTTAVTYKAAEKGLLESVMAKLFTLGEGTDQGIMDQVKQSGKEMIAGDIGKAAAGAVSNPMKFNLFEGVEFREFSYNFVLYPKNESESQDIRHMVHAFKRSSLPGILPGSADRVYTFPNEWATDKSLGNKLKDVTGVGQARLRDGTIVDESGLSGNTFFAEGDD